ncbi:uncharacterized protein DS421_16g528650 [Arachis hypogaea]|nr:uncharacterized protein DS421_16g528650 [Arachis hypogaea]
MFLPHFLLVAITPIYFALQCTNEGILFMVASIEWRPNSNSSTTTTPVRLSNNTDVP